MTLKHHRRKAAANGHTTSEPVDLRPRLPDDFPNETTRNPENRAPQYPRTVDKRLVQRILRMLESTMVIQEVDRFLRDHPERQSRLSTKSLLLGMILDAYETGRYLRSDTCSFLNGLDHRIGIELGLWTWDTRQPVTYTMTQKQIKRIETAIFEARWSSNERPRSIDWFMDALLDHTIPAHARKAIIAVSLDWTPMPTWAVTRDFRIEEEIRKTQKPEDTGEIGTLDQRKRAIRSADDGARSGYRTATNKTPAGPFTGYYGHMPIPTRGASWNGNPKHLTLGGLPPKHVAHGRAIPAQNDNALNGLHAALAAHEAFPNLEEVVADRGYTIFGKDFVRPLHRLGINVVMEYPDEHQKTIEIVEIGPEREQQQILLLHCGTFLVEWTPEYFWTPPLNLTGEALSDWYAERDKYTWKPIGKPDKNGNIRFRCPQCDGRIKTNAKTRIRSKRSQRKASHATNIDQEYCCNGTITIPVEKLDTYQRIPFGTAAWKKSYGRRLQIENLNSLVKNDGALEDGWCRAFGKAAHNFGLLAVLLAHNLRQPNNFDNEDETSSEPPSTTTSSRQRPRSTPNGANGLKTRDPPG
ncbi:MAG: hypothetical protein OXC98_04995 [bacterium]|nr:transposase [Acidimicrobiia bacterium]MCY4649706.1 hypothetical protein [bacterium]